MRVSLLEPSIQKSGLAELAAAGVATRPGVVAGRGAEARVLVPLGAAEPEGDDEDEEEGMVTLSMLRWRFKRRCWGPPGLAGCSEAARKREDKAASGGFSAPTPASGSGADERSGRGRKLSRAA